MPVAWFLALRFLREYRAQTVLTMTAVAVGVGVMVFLSALINGLQTSLIDRTLGTQAHVVIRPREERARPVRVPRAEHEVIRRVERPAQRIRSVTEWQRVDERLAREPHVVATSPTAMGDAFAMRGLASRPVVVLGVVLERFDQVIPIRARLLRGSPRLDGNDAFIGAELADALGVDVGDQIRIQVPGGEDALVVVQGVFDLGNQQVNERWVVMALRRGQTLLGLPGGANALHVTVDSIFEADQVAARIRDDTGLVVESWMQTNEQLLIGLRSQSSSSYTIQFFVFLAAAIGIASVLVVSVVQRTREIGILRAMGTPRRRVAAVFLLQGAVIGLVGSFAGCAFGAALSLAFARLAQNPDGSPTFPMALTPTLFLTATALATVTGMSAALVPARRASRLDPVEAIRHV